MKLGIQYLENYNKEWGLVSSKEGDSGYDLRAAISEPIVLSPGERKIVPNGIKTQLYSSINVEIQIRPRSGLAAKNLLSIISPSLYIFSPPFWDNNYSFNFLRGCTHFPRCTHMGTWHIYAFTPFYFPMFPLGSTATN